ncbi:MAG: hypothetical protein A2068_06085 [Ignavibacteria bacterium GWB2_35_6b]|nr:MAG: hypothetical protein A2068_06085 [Ignavibacteria bacterium GWB2_35_6b]
MNLLLKKYYTIFVRQIFIIIMVIIFIALTSCDKGIEPYPSETEIDITSFEGKVTFTGAWPDSIARTYIVVFSEPSRFDVTTLQYIIGPVPYGVTEYNYNSIENNLGLIPKLNAGSYPYVIVAQSKTPELSLQRKDWTVAGIYFNEGNTTTPGILNIENGKVTKDININCDFNNPPVQPPAKNNFENE